MKTTATRETITTGAFQIIPFKHAQGCCGYLLAESAGKEAMAIDVHLDLVHEMEERAKAELWNLRYVVDTHTHADHPSGSAAIAVLSGCTRMARKEGGHAGVTLHPADGEEIPLGNSQVTVRYTPGHTPDHMSLSAGGAFFSGDSLFIGGVARTDFLGGDAGVLFDSIHGFLAEFPDETILLPGHDYEGHISSTFGEAKKSNPWLQISDRATFIKHLTANPPPRPANMDHLLRLNREGVSIPAVITADEAVSLIKAGGAGSVVDVRSGAEFTGEHIPGSRLIPLDQIGNRADEVMSTPVPRLMLCRSGKRAAAAKESLEKLHVAGMSVIDGGILAYIEAGGETVKGKAVISLERQVRIAAGVLVLTGVLAGSVLHPGFLIISGFVGAGLIFAGITDWCGMGLLLAKMPWNRGSGASEETSPAHGTCSATLPGSCSAGAPPAGGGCSAAPPPADEESHDSSKK